jgi:A nuclease family of the HNH/ENDO VII superfamily with conserved AHH
VLVHNASVITAGMSYGCENVAGNGDIGRGDVNSNIAGGVPANYQGHHLIGVVEAGQSEAIKRAVMLGYSVNGKNNGIALPSYGEVIDKQKAIDESKRTGLPLHRGRHAAVRYTDCVKAHLKKLDADLSAERVTDCDLCERIKLIENEIRRALLAHEIWLHKEDPHIKLGQNPSCTA